MTLRMIGTVIISVAVIGAVLAAVIFLAIAADNACKAKGGTWEVAYYQPEIHFVYDSKGNIQSSYTTMDPVYDCKVKK